MRDLGVARAEDLVAPEVDAQHHAESGAPGAQRPELGRGRAVRLQRLWLTDFRSYESAELAARVRPMVLAGEIDSIGRNVTAFKVGDPVFAHAQSRGRGKLNGSHSMRCHCGADSRPRHGSVSSAHTSCSRPARSPERST